jgi:hypothetical protein
MAGIIDIRDFGNRYYYEPGYTGQRNKYQVSVSR